MEEITLFYYISTYGCQMNVHESEKIAGQLKELGYTQTDVIENADVVVFNTCTIRENAVAKAYGHIGNLKKLKKAKKDLIIAVGGCMTQDIKQAEDLKSKFPYIDVIFGTHNLSQLGKLIKRKIATKKKVFEVPESEIGYDMEAPKYRTSYPNAWVNIMYGCNNFCSYCIVPYVRGRERSRPFEDIVEEVKSLLEEGYKEITLLGQNVNSYGNDLNSKEANFPHLMETLAKLPYKYRLRFMTSHPKDFSFELANVIAKYDNICKFIHIPCQSGANDVLAAMNRRYTRETYLEKIDYIKEHVNNYALSTDIMVGFPGETEEDFLQTLDLVEKARFSSAFMFEYSPRHNTVAAKMDNQIPEDVKTDRIQRLIAKVNGISKEISNSYIGKSVEILVEDYHDGLCMGRTDSGKMVSFPFDKGEELFGKFVMVKISDTTISSLKGEYVG
ncbi:MAG: tRNA (N6-isopentenyl adenosine(37)-C2)-methylthiotransferase MiaB [Clostridia bacterium]|nr:tRNA (N6-isopentenyl adenosine(37)-C2)-methylthiotransferase MiaB [Clostridia bacterium]